MGVYSFNRAVGPIGGSRETSWWAAEAVHVRDGGGLIQSDGCENREKWTD